MTRIPVSQRVPVPGPGVSFLLQFVSSRELQGATKDSGCVSIPNLLPVCGSPSQTDLFQSTSQILSCASCLFKETAKQEKGKKQLYCLLCSGQGAHVVDAALGSRSPSSTFDLTLKCPLQDTLVPSLSLSCQAKAFLWSWAFHKHQCVLLFLLGTSGFSQFCFIIVPIFFADIGLCSIHILSGILSFRTSVTNFAKLSAIRAAVENWNGLQI